MPIAFGILRFTPHDFYEMTPHEFYQACKGYRNAQDEAAWVKAWNLSYLLKAQVKHAPSIKKLYKNLTGNNLPGTDIKKSKDTEHKESPVKGREMLHSIANKKTGFDAMTPEERARDLARKIKEYRRGRN